MTINSAQDVYFFIQVSGALQHTTSSD